MILHLVDRHRIFIINASCCRLKLDQNWHLFNIRISFAIPYWSKKPWQMNHLFLDLEFLPVYEFQYLSYRFFHIYLYYALDVILFFFQNEATFPLVRRDYYRKTIQGGLYINRGITLWPSSRIWDYVHNLSNWLHNVSRYL